MYAIPAWYGFLNKNHILQINEFFSLHSSTVMSNLLSVLNNYCKIMMINCFIKQLIGTMPRITFSSDYSSRTLGRGLCENFIKSQLHKMTFIQ